MGKALIEIIHLDLNIVEHCNFHCTACSHASPLHKPWSMGLEEAEQDILALKPFLKVRNVNIVGGEPTLHPQLVEIMRLLKRIRLDEATHVITNGSLLPRMTEEFWKELEFLKVSIYGRLDPAIPLMVEEKSKELGFGIEMTEFKEFFLQLEAIPDGSSFHDCPWKTDCYTVHRGYFYLCPQTTFFPGTLMGLPKHVDGLPLKGLTEDKLHDFMHRTEPFNACRTCRGYTKKVPWSETKGREEWVKNSQLN